MWEIAICDDDKYFCDKLKNIIMEKIKYNDLIIFNNLFSQIKNYSVDLLFMDIALDKHNGILLAREYQRIYNHVKVVFITSEISFMHDTFDASPYYFIRKDYLIDDFNKLLSKLKEDEEMASKSINIMVNRVEIKLKFDQIRYVEVIKNNCFIHTAKNEYKIYMSMSKLLSYLDGRFCRINKSEVINFDYLYEINKYDIEMQTGETLKISKKDRDDIYKKYYLYVM